MERKYDEVKYKFKLMWSESEVNWIGNESQLIYMTVKWRWIEIEVIVKMGLCESEVMCKWSEVMWKWGECEVKLQNRLFS